MEEVNKINKLMYNVNQIETLFNEKIPLWESKKSHYDKVGYGFTTGDRSIACGHIHITFTSYMGTYGDSGVGKQLSLDKEIFEEHLLKYLNKNKKIVMLEIAKSIKEEASLIKESAIKELTEEINKFKEIES